MNGDVRVLVATTREGDSGDQLTRQPGLRGLLRLGGQGGQGPCLDSLENCEKEVMACVVLAPMGWY